MSNKLSTPTERRDLFVSEVSKRTLGPGFAEDGFDYPDVEREILNLRPEDVYYTGVLFPKASDTTADGHSSQVLVSSMNHGPVEVIEDDDDLNGDSDSASSEEDDAQTDSETVSRELRAESSETDDWKIRFAPSHIGLITCVRKDATVKVSVSYAKYEKAELQDVRVKLGDISISEFNELLGSFNQDEKVRQLLQLNGIASLYDVFIVDESSKTVALSKPLRASYLDKNGNKQERPARVSDFPGVKNQHIKSIFSRLFSSFFKRVPYNVNPITLKIDGEKKTGQIPFPGNKDLSYALKVFTEDKIKYYVKLIVINTTEKEENIFQTVIRLESNDFQSYRDIVDDSFDMENEENDYIYRNELDYGKGVGCAVHWDEMNPLPLWIETSYLPIVAVKKFSNEANKEYDSNIESYCKLYDLSVWGDKNNIVPNLTRFVKAYQLWHQNQAKEAASEPQYYKISKAILDRQEELLERFNQNIQFLTTNPEALECFRIANTAMYLQMIIAKDNRFKSGREYKDTISDTTISNMDYFKNRKSGLDPTYRPFQLAFLLMNVKPLFDNQDAYHDVVDLIWFPTGGGKTEAYLALTALTIVARRRIGYRTGQDVSGVSVIMRYTLRLLTSQQFERASFLICALEYLRRECSSFCLGEEPIRIGMWIGGSSAPNWIRELKNQRVYTKYFDDVARNSLPQIIPFPISCCPWCGTKLTTIDPGNNNVIKGYRQDDGRISCVNDNCCFTDELPIDYIDENIYSNPPTLLFATVDKFANLYLDRAGELFGVGTNRKRPELIIQDELHLVSGPLGSMVGLFETIVEKLCEDNGAKPRIIASTATTRNTQFLIQNLYRRGVSVFPASGIEYNDNYFSHVEIGNTRRVHLGIMPTGQKSVTTEINLISILVAAKFKFIVEWLRANNIDPSDASAVYGSILTHQAKGNEDDLIREIDDFWTLVVYYNSLKDLGRSKSRIPQEIMERIRVIYSYTDSSAVLDSLLLSIDQRNREFTSREDSSRIKELLTEAESRTKLIKTSSNKWRVSSNMDLVQASNMISVGIDISRWNLMLMVGQPRSTAEYIQSSSRVARSSDGLVINLMNPNRNREFSLFENYTSFHKMYYKYVEPLSATPFTEMTLDKMLSNMAITYMRHVRQEKAKDVTQSMFDEFHDYIVRQIDPTEVQLINYITTRLNDLWQDWSFVQNNVQNANYADIEAVYRDKYGIATSMRSVDGQNAIRIDDLKYN